MSRRALTIVLSIVALTASAPTQGVERSGDVVTADISSATQGHYIDRRHADSNEETVGSLSMIHHVHHAGSHNAQQDSALDPLGGMPGIPPPANHPRASRRDMALSRDPFGGDRTTEPVLEAETGDASNSRRAGDNTPLGGSSHLPPPAQPTVKPPGVVSDNRPAGGPPGIPPKRPSKPKQIGKRQDDESYNGPQGGPPGIPPPPEGQKPHMGKRHKLHKSPPAKDAPSFAPSPPNRAENPVGGLPYIPPGASHFDKVARDLTYDEIVASLEMPASEQGHVQDRRDTESEEVTAGLGMPPPTGGHVPGKRDTTYDEIIATEGTAPTTSGQIKAKIDTEFEPEQSSEAKTIVRRHVHYDDQVGTAELPPAKAGTPTELPPAKHRGEENDAPKKQAGHIFQKRDHHLGKREYYPAMSWVKGYRPVIDESCKVAVVTTGIQDSECYKNVRVHHTTADPGLQSFATFQMDHSYDNNHYIFGGTCMAYKCSLAKIVGWVKDCDWATYAWNDSLLHTNDFGGIQEPMTGLLECETSDGIQRGRLGEWGCAKMPGSHS